MLGHVALLCELLLADVTLECLFFGMPDKVALDVPGLVKYLVAVIDETDIMNSEGHGFFIQLFEGVKPMAGNVSKTFVLVVDYSLLGVVLPFFDGLVIHQHHSVVLCLFFLLFRQAINSSCLETAIVDRLW